MMLDVGCGHNARGDVNVDLFPRATDHRSKDQSKCVDLDLDLVKINNFIVAEASHLPFKDRSFDKVICYHMIEHTDAQKTFSELVRVSKKYIEIKCPTKWGDLFGDGLFKRRKKLLRHTLYIDKDWLRTESRKHPVIEVNCVYSYWIYFPHFAIPLLRFPSEILYELRRYD